MAQAGTLITGDGVATPITGLGALEEMILIGDVDTAMPLEGLNITMNGETTFDIPNNAAILTAFSKLFMPMTAAAPVVGMLLRVATGRINAKSDGPGCNLRLINAGVTTPGIFTSSTNSKSRITGQNAAPIKVSTDTINPTSVKVYKEFSALIVSDSANIATIDVEMWDGTQQQLTMAEADAWFAAENATEANGKLVAATTSFDNRDRKYKSVRFTTGAGAGGLTVAIINLPQQYFDAEKSALTK